MGRETGVIQALRSTALFAALAALLSCAMPTRNENIAEDDAVGPGLYVFDGIYIPGSSEWTVRRIVVEPFSLANALESIYEPGTYMIVLEQDETLPVMVRMNIPGLAIVLKGYGGERCVTRAPGGTDGPLFDLEYSSLALGSGVALVGSPEEYAAPVVRIGRKGILETYRGSRISGGGASGVQVGTAVDQDARFTMYGGEISGCIAEGAGGGGVNVEYGGAFTLKGGVIKNNEVTGSPVGTNAGGGGVRVGSGRFVMECGEIINNTSPLGGGGISGPVSLRGGRVAGNIRPADSDWGDLYKNFGAPPSVEGREAGNNIEDWTKIFGLKVNTLSGYSVLKGRTGGLSAEVVGLGGQNRALLWELISDHNPQTVIDPETGAITVASGEVYVNLRVRVTVVGDPSLWAELTVNTVSG